MHWKKLSVLNLQKLTYIINYVIRILVKLLTIVLQYLKKIKSSRRTRDVSRLFFAFCRASRRIIQLPSIGIGLITVPRGCRRRENRGTSGMNRGVKYLRKTYRRRFTIMMCLQTAKDHTRIRYGRIRRRRRHAPQARRF